MTASAVPPSAAEATREPLFPAPIRPAVTAIEPQQILAVAQAAMDDPDVIALWYGESDVPTPAFIRDACSEALGQGQTFYTHKRGTPALRDALSSYLSDLHDRPVDSERISVTASGMSAIMMLFQCIVEAGDNVIVVSPVWPNAQSVVRALGGEARFHALDRDPAGGWTLDVDALAAKIDGRTRAIFVNSPNNPTGWVMPRAQIDALLELARAHGLWIMADEVYGRMVYEGRAAPSFLDAAGPEDPVLVVNSFSKSWAMTGWRVGWAVHPPGLGDLLGNMIEFNYSCVPPFVMRAAEVALAQGEDFVRWMTDYCRAGREIVDRRLPALPRVSGYRPPDASFYAFFRIEGTEDRMLETARWLVREAKVGMAPGSAFGPGAEGWYRLCFAQAPERLETALDRLDGALSRF